MSRKDTPIISRLGADDMEGVRAILESSRLHVDLEAELKREIALPWLIRDPENGAPWAFLLAWCVVDELHLLELASHPEQRRKGLARALLVALLAHARAQHTRLILLEVRRSNLPAIALYESFGFETTGVRRGYYSDTGEDALEMRITLNPNTGEVLPESSQG
ncbi:MAG: ribosomal protein S18-alanine N-acetyltransferase [Polyangiaceae bacterium]